MANAFPYPALTFAAWQALDPETAAREFTQRVESLPDGVRKSALACVPSADALSQRFEAASTGQPLSRVPCLVKDMYDIGGVETHAGSTFLPTPRPPHPQGQDGAYCQALTKAGVVIAGKTHMTEFAYGLSGQNAHYGDCFHPLFPDRTSGGSSSGSAAAVAAGVVPFATGSDTGGSIRIPAAFCGLYGMRLSPYHPWIEDAVPLVPAFDAPGWFTANAADMHAVLDTLIPLTDATRSPTASPARGCYLELPGLDADVSAACKAAAAKLAPPPTRKMRAALLQSFADAESAYTVIGGLAAWETHRAWYAEYRDQYSPPTRERLEKSQQFTAEQIASARAARDQVMRSWHEFFGDYEFMVLPAAPFAAPTADKIDDDYRRRILDLTAPASLGGLPVLTLPLPLGPEAGGLTTGLQIVVKDCQSHVLRSLLRQWEPIVASGFSS